MARVSHATPRNHPPIFPVSRVALERLRKARAKSATKAMRGCIAFLFRALAGIPFSLRASAQRDHRWRKPRPIHRRAVTERGGFFVSITNLIQFFVPEFHVRAVSRFLITGDWHITVLRKPGTSCLSRAPDWGSPVSGKAEGSPAAEIEC